MVAEACGTAGRALRGDVGGKAVSVWTREEAAGMLHLCSAGKHWVTTPTCDSCAMNEHRCPPTLAEINELVQDAQRLAIMVEKVRTEVRKAADGRLS